MARSAALAHLLVLGIALLPSLTACSDPVAVDPARDIRIATGDRTFTIHNRSRSLTLAVVIVDGRLAPLISLAPCDTWPRRVAPGGHERVPYDEVSDDPQTSEGAFVFWCFLRGKSVVDGGSLVIDFG